LTAESAIKQLDATQSHQQRADINKR
jgi:hypothetical protein